ncbi:MORN repeat protein [Leptospira ryugenii]|uniref:MORN repeat protein n=1 Tax=Leptospira ryugenii TaxID=1917863 RepID=A0A2P2E1C9_9LEPT|nr:hypothetical protein [Leptospira ryugenii]GBF50697.1 MORN repeat protein [Leptospira ryugenii]
MKISTVFILLLFICNCLGSNSRPKSVPIEAKYNRKLNLYILQKDGFEYSWYENGNLIAKTQLNEYGMYNGLAERYDYNSGLLITKGAYTLSEKSGQWVWKYSDGKPYYEMNFSPGVRKRKFWYPTLEWGNENGQYVRYFPNGRVSEKGSYDGGNRSGDWVKYYPDTKIESKGTYFEDYKVGDWFYYYPDGRKEAIEVYSPKGDLLQRITYYPNGSVWCETKSTLEPKCF